MGWVTGDLSDNKINRWWLESALALGGLVGTGSNLLELSHQSLSDFRARLMLQRPFEGQFYVDQPHRPTVFSTVRDGLTFMGLLNRQNTPQRIEARLSDYGVQGLGRTVYVPEIDSAAVVTDAISADLPGEAFRLVIIPTSAGVVWTDSSFQQELGGNELRLAVQGPPDTSGFAVVYAPGLRRVILDGRSISEGAPGVLRPIMSGDYEYDASTGILRLWYRHDRLHNFRIEMVGATPDGQ
jgi:hypothetical protein